MEKIITGDIIGSEVLTAEERNKIRALLETLSSGSASKYDFFIRGDSFQVMAADNALREGLQIQTFVHYQTGIRMRLSIGVGKSEFLLPKLSDSDGEVFRLSGRGLDLIKAANTTFGVFTANPVTNLEWDIHSSVIDYFYQSLTRNQSEALYWLLNNHTQTEIAGIIGKSQSSVSARIKGSGWQILHKIIDRFSTL